MIFDIEKEIAKANMLTLHSIFAGIEIGQRTTSNAAPASPDARKPIPLPPGAGAVVGQLGEAA